MVFGSVQNLTASNKYKVIVENGDTIIVLKMTKSEASLLRKYIVLLEKDSKINNINTKKIKILEDKISLMVKGNSNLKEQINYLKTTIINKEKINNIESEKFKVELKKVKKKSFNTGFVFGGTLTLIVCLILVI